MLSSGKMKLRTVLDETAGWSDRFGFIIIHFQVFLISPITAYAVQTLLTLKWGDPPLAKSKGHNLEI